MSDAFVEQNTMLFRNSVTFVTGFGVIADAPFNVGSPTSQFSVLNTYNQINPIGGISGYSNYYNTGTNGLSGTFLGSVNINTGLVLNALTGNGIFSDNGNFVALKLDASKNFDILCNGKLQIVSMDSAYLLSNNSINIKSNSALSFSASNSSLNFSPTQILFKDTGSNNSLETNGRVAYDSGGAVALNWSGRILSGNWNAQGLQISGANVTVASSWSNLTWGTGTIWPAASNIVEDKSILYLTGNTTLTISNLYNGWNGVLQVIQSGASSSGYSLTLPAGTKVMGSGNGLANLTRQSGAIDCLGFAYDGTKLLMNIGNQFN